MPSDNDNITILARVQPLLVNRGALFEADIFTLLLGCPHIIRAFEFALTDGAVCCSVSPLPSGTYSERFWELNEQVQQDPHLPTRTLLLFDVKSASSPDASKQVYHTTLRQRDQVSFYITICAANPDFVEVHPNLAGECPDRTDDGDRAVAVAISRKSPLPPATYGSLSPCNSPYRMPACLLPQAIQNLRQCALGLGPYMNPWTHVEFEGWRPRIVSSNMSLIPAEHTQLFSGYIGTMRIWRAIRVAKAITGLPLDFDFINLQPRLADFKLLVPPLSQQPQLLRQVFVQYKIDSRDRSIHTPLTRVAIGRNSGRAGIRWYFTNVDQFDYLWYEFNYLNRDTRTPSRVFYLLPEKEIPDSFYTSLSLEADFTLPSFNQYRIDMDCSGVWVQRVYEIIQNTPHPRRSMPRPARSYQLSPEHESPGDLSLTSANESHDQVYNQFCGKFFDAIMAHCASYGSGLLVVLSRGHPIADFAFCQYHWSPQEQAAFMRHGRMPCTISDLPAATPLLPLCIYSTKQKEGTSRGPSLSAAEFRRLNSCSYRRLLLFDIFGVDGKDVYPPLFVVPSEDVSPTKSHRTIYSMNLKLAEQKAHMQRVPLLAEQLHTGLALCDYLISARGPLIFESDDTWGGVWALLRKFTGVDSFTYPEASECHRAPANFKVSVQEFHQRLAYEHARSFAS